MCANFLHSFDYKYLKKIKKFAKHDCAHCLRSKFCFTFCGEFAMEHFRLEGNLIGFKEKCPVCAGNDILSFLCCCRFL